MAERSLIIACGALAREITHLKAINGWHHLELTCLDASLHNTPARIPARLKQKLDEAEDRYDKILVAYADCGTGGEIDRLIAGLDHVQRLPGPHCFATFAGLADYEAVMDKSPGTFWLTDFLARHFHTMVVKSLGLDKHPELMASYFGHYSGVTYLSQSEDQALLGKAREAAAFLNLEFHHRPVGYGQLEQPLQWCAA